MNATTARKLVRLNREFYDAFAGEFADSRSALQPGIPRALRALGEFGSLVDVGCGDGRLGRALAGGLAAHSVDRYVGVDYSRRLLDRGGQLAAGFELVPGDITEPGWTVRAGLLPATFEAAVCFSTLHHIPGSRRRLRLLRDIRSLLRPGARCAASVWQFLHVPRLRRKTAAWSEAGLRPGDVDRGDFLLDWRRGGRGLRYVHHFDEGELVDLCRRAGFAVVETYRSDGGPDGRGEMGLYILLGAMIY